MLYLFKRLWCLLNPTIELSYSIPEQRLFLRNVAQNTNFTFLHWLFNLLSCQSYVSNILCFTKFQNYISLTSVSTDFNNMGRTWFNTTFVCNHTYFDDEYKKQGLLSAVAPTLGSRKENNNKTWGCDLYKQRKK